MKARIARKIIKRNLYNKWCVGVANTKDGVFEILSKGCLNLLPNGHWNKAIIRQLNLQGHLDGNFIIRHVMMPTGKLINAWDLCR